MRDVIRGSAIALALKAVAAFIAFGFNLVLAKKLGADATGVFFLCLTISVIAAVLSRIGMDNTLLRFTAEYTTTGNWGAVKGLYRQAMAIAVPASLVMSVVLACVSPWMSASIFGKPELAQPLTLMSLTVTSLVLLNLHAELLKGVKRVPSSLVVQNVALPSFAILPLVLLGSHVTLRDTVLIYVLAAALTALIGVWLWRNSAMSYSQSSTPFPYSKLMRSCLPLYSASIMTRIIIPWAPILFLGVWASSADVGIFSAASRTAALTSFILVAVNSIAAPKFAALFRLGDIDGLRNTVRHSTILMTTAALPALIVFIFVPDLVMGIFGKEFVVGENVLTILALGQFVNVATGSVDYLLMMSGNERLFRNNAIFSAVTITMLCLVLIPSYGIVGAAIAVAVSMATTNFALVFLVWRRLGIISVPFVKEAKPHTPTTVPQTESL